MMKANPTVVSTLLNELLADGAVRPPLRTVVPA